MFFCVVSLMLASAALATSYLPITDLGSLLNVDPGNIIDTAYGYSISPNGNVAGTSEYESSSIGVEYARGFLWTPTSANGPTGSMIDVGTLNPVTPTAESRGTSGVNNSGQVAGDCSNSASATHAFLYSGGSLYDLGCLGTNAAATSRAYAINSTGEVCGLSYMNGSGQSGNGQIFCGLPRARTRPPAPCTTWAASARAARLSAPDMPFP